MSEEPDLVLVGTKVALGPLRRDLAALQARWLNSEDVRYGLQNHAVSTKETEEKWIDETVAAGAEEDGPKASGFMIYDRTDLAPVGNATLFGVNHMNGTSKFGILLGERRGLGLGTEATWLVTGFGFEVLGLRNIMLEVLDWNVGAQRAYERAGFRRIGARRGAAMSRGARCDIVLMDAVPEDRPASL